MTIWPWIHKRKTPSPSFTRSKKIYRSGRGLKFCGTVHYIINPKWNAFIWGTFSHSYNHINFLSPKTDSTIPATEGIDWCIWATENSINIHSYQLYIQQLGPQLYKLLTVGRMRSVILLFLHYRNSCILNEIQPTAFLRVWVYQFSLTNKQPILFI